MSKPDFTRTQLAYQTLKQLVMENELKPSASYLEAELAERLGMSRTPVREAALQLESEGYLSIRPRHGITVLPISVQDMSEIYELLIELEPYAAERLAQRGITAEEVAALQSHVDTMDKALAEDDLIGWADADEAFHTDLVRFSGNARLLKVIETFWGQVHRARIATLTLRPKPTQSNEDHQALITCLEAGNAKTARDLHRAHRQRAKDMLVALIQKHNLDNL